MIEALKNMNRRLLSLLIIIILLPIFIIIFLAIIQSCSNKTISHEQYEKKMISAATKYFKDNNKLPSYGGNASVTLETLVKDGYIESTNNLVKDESCSGSVSVRNNGNNEAIYNYNSNLICKEYKKNSLSDILLSKIVSNGNGLYKTEENYIFKGDEVDNYITFYGVSYRIMGIEDGLVKMIKVESEDNSKIWDNKYNKEIGYSYGKNIYADSQVLKALNSDYSNNKKISVEARKHLVAHNACVGKRKIGDYSISKVKDCAEVLTNQLVTLPTASDYALASLDPDCNSVVEKSCRNYNYLKNVLYSSWTLNAVSDNTYEVYYLNNGVLEYQYANNYNEYNYIIYIDGNEKIVEGEGTSQKPFIIG